jgi:hypothetical protein
MKRETLLTAATAVTVTVAAAGAVFAAGVVHGHLTAGPAVVQDGNEIAGISATRAVDPSAALAYMRAHPVPPKPGMTAGIITSVTELGDQPGTGLGSAQCAGVKTAAYLVPAVGQDPCTAWYFTVVTPAGKTLRVSCGGLGAPCLAPQNVMPGDEGQYLYVPSAGQVTPAAPVAYIGCWTPVTYPCPFSAAVIP